MRKNLTRKTILILAILLVFIGGFIGIPKGVSRTALKQSIADRIHLGLDLSGGTHLILQVMVSEAVGATSDSDLQRMMTDLQTGRRDRGDGHQARPEGAAADYPRDRRTAG